MDRSPVPSTRARLRGRRRTPPTSPRLRQVRRRLALACLGIGASRARPRSQSNARLRRCGAPRFRHRAIHRWSRTWVARAPPGGRASRSARLPPPGARNCRRGRPRARGCARGGVELRRPYRRRGRGGASKLHSQHGRGCAGLSADADFDRPVTHDQGTPVAGTVPAVDGVMGTAP